MKQTIEDVILLQRNVGKAIRMLRKRIGELNIIEEADALDAIAEDYRLMCNAVSEGMSDPCGREIYDGLLRRVFVVYSNIRLCSIVRRRPSFVQCKKEALRTGGWQETVLERLEGYVQDTAMASLLQAEERDCALEKLHLSHQKDMDALFCALLVSRQWTEKDRLAYSNLLMSPTIDPNDAMLVVSAVTMSLLTVFDVNKWLVLASVYESGCCVQMRQRALVGLALAMPDKEAGLYDVQNVVDSLFAATPLAQDLLELQMQMVYCARTEDDYAAIRRDLMPTFQSRFWHDGWQGGDSATDEKTLDEILGGGSDDKAMAELEEKIARVRDMQSSGVDIYFGGFAKMKGFPFFGRISNWFVPFSTSHPDIAAVLGNGEKKGISALLDGGAFCDSDKYSLVFAIDSVYDKIPQNVRESLSAGNVPNRGWGAADDTESATFVRRVYLQNLYRFFYVYSGRKDFYNPFEGFLGGAADSKSFFVMNPTLKKGMADVIGGLVRFLFKHRQYPMLITLVESRTSAGDASFDERCLLGYSYMRMGRCDAAVGVFGRLAEECPQNTACLKGFSRSLFVLKRYAEAGDLYGRLLEADSGNIDYTVGRSVAFINSGNPRAGMADLFKTDFECPDNAKVKRAMAWGYLVEAKPADAERVYVALRQFARLEGSDLLNLGYAKWFQSEITDAVGLFVKYVSGSLDGDVERLAADFHADVAVLEANGIENFAENIMLDLVLQALGQSEA